MSNSQIKLLTSLRKINEIENIKEKIYFYFKIKDNIVVINSLTSLEINSTQIVLVYKYNIPKYLYFKYSNFFNINPYENSLDGWEWHRAVNYFNNKDVTGVEHTIYIKKIISIIIKCRKSKYFLFRIIGMGIQFILKKSEHLIKFNDIVISESKGKFFSLKNRLTIENKFDKIYIFGTGPSLSKAINTDWSDGIRLVCNTVVKNKDLWHHINPNIIVAGDAIYHFGLSEFAKCFRDDLKKRLTETDTVFIYPMEFHCFVKSELKEFQKQLIPIPVLNKVNFNYVFDKSFSLPQLGNSLNLLSLPVAINLVKNIFLWGFDGKAPKDTNFWQNYSNCFYDEHIAELKNLHPAFFHLFLDTNKKKSYVENVHGYKLEKNLQQVERKGYKFIMLHRSYTKTLNKRYYEN